MAKAPVQTVKQAKKSGAQDNRTPNSRVEYSNPEAVVKFTLHTQKVFGYSPVILTLSPGLSSI